MVNATIQELLAQGISPEVVAQLVQSGQGAIGGVPQLADLGSSDANRRQRDLALAQEQAMLGLPSNTVGAVVGNGLSSLGGAVAAQGKALGSALPESIGLVNAGPKNGVPLSAATPSPALQALAGLAQGVGSGIGNLAAQTNSKLDFFRSPDNPAVQARAKAKTAANSSGQNQAAASILAQLERGFGNSQANSPTSAGSAGLVFGDKTPQPTAPTHQIAAPTDFSAIDNQLNVLRGLAGTKADLSTIKDLLLSTKPNAPTEKELKQLRLAGLFEGLAGAGARINGDTPAGTAILQLGLGALSGDAAGKKAEIAAKRSFDDDLRKFAQAQIQFEQFRMQQVDQTLDKKKEIELLQLGVDQNKAQDAVRVAQAQRDAQYQNELLNYQADLDRAQKAGIKIMNVTKTGIVTSVATDINGNQTIQQTPGVSGKDLNAAITAGGTEGAIRALNIARSQGPVTMSQTLINLLKTRGMLNQLFDQKALDKVQSDSINNVIGITALGTDSKEVAAEQQQAIETATLAAALMQSDTLRLQAYRLLGLRIGGTQ